MHLAGVGSNIHSGSLPNFLSAILFIRCYAGCVRFLPYTVAIGVLARQADSTLMGFAHALFYSVKLIDIHLDGGLH
ncbi:hypothetical protein KDAU_63240 [Dictyobacter aurantiacus]|uniref:Uncharacterized protein n=1 Tax=Dictyobacter aurantiacus TaxID=1936993 RepID=A0A401ZQ48_9CHLR|nr:hypothetical protein KDAU_63240 [Dictyobacter aurantiacus]